MQHSLFVSKLKIIIEPFKTSTPILIAILFKRTETIIVDIAILSIF